MRVPTFSTEVYERMYRELFSPLPIQIKKLPNFPSEHVRDDQILTPACPEDAGSDIHSAEDVVLCPGQRRIVKTGLAIAIPAGYEAQIRPRSGNAAKRGLTVLNTPGTIDAGYRGEIGVILYNANPILDGALMDDTMRVIEGDDVGFLHENFDKSFSENTIRINRGDRIAQVVIASIKTPSGTLVEKFDPTVRGDGGFGSTGS